MAMARTRARERAQYMKEGEASEMQMSSLTETQLLGASEVART